MSNEIEISIFVDEQEVSLDKSQKELLYDELKKVGPHGAPYYDLLFDLDEHIEKSKQPNTNMPEILAKWLLDHTIPIISNEVINRTKKKDEFSISMESEHALKCFSLKTKKIIYLARGDQFQLHGLLVPRQKFGKMTKMYDYYSMASACDLLQAGFYGSNLPLKGRNIGIYSSYSTPKFLFVDDGQAKQIMEKLIKYVTECELMHDALSIFRLEDLQILNCRELGFLEIPKLELPKQHETLIFEDFDKNLLTMLDPIQPTKFNEFYTNILGALVQEGNLPIYNLGYFLGDNHADFTSKIDTKKKQFAFEDSYGRQVKDAQRTFNKLSLMKIISLEKFQTSKLDSLTDKQKKLVELEYNKREKAANAKLDTKLIKLFDSLAFLHGKKLKSALKEIAESAKQDIKNKTIVESAGVCSHHYYKYLFIDEIGHTNVAQERLLFEFALPMEENTHYCKVCGEKLAEEDVEAQLNFFGDRIVNIGMNESDPIQTIIWKEATNIVSTYVRFTDPIPTKSLINSLVAGLRNVVQFEESQLFKIKNVDGSSRDSTSLFAAIYIYAALAALMYHNPGKMTFAKEKSNAKTEKNDIDPTQTIKSELAAETKTATGSGQIKAKIRKNKISKIQSAEANDETKKALQNGHLVVKGGKVVVVKDSKKAEEMTVRNALLLLIISKDLTRQKLNVTVPMLSTMFSKAYKWALEHAKPIQVDRDIAKQLQIDPITFDSFYQFINRVNLHSYFAGHRKFPPALNDIVANIGKTKEQVMKMTNPYGDLSLVKQWKIELGEYRGLPEYEKYVYDCYVALHEYLTQAVFSVSAVPIHVRLEDYRKKYQYLLDFDAKYQTIIKRRKLKPFLRLKTQEDITWIRNRFLTINLANHYCPSGNFHKGGEYVFAPKSKTKTKDERVIKKDEILAWIKTNDKDKIQEFANLEIVDERCQLCGLHFRHAIYDDKTLQKLKKIHENQDNIYAFYSYYESRCPVDNLHEMSNNTCTKCGYNPEWKKQNDITEDPYYNKYVSKFKTIRKNENKIEFTYTNRSSQTEKTKYSVKDIKWEYSLRYTNELSKMFDIKYNIIINLGLLEKISFIYIEQTKLNPSKDAYSQKARSLRIRDYILFAMREYMEIVKYNEVAQIKPEIKKLLDDQKKIRPSDNLTETLPNLPEFVEENERYEMALVPEKYTNWLQEFLAKMLVDIVLNSKEKDKPFAKNIASYLLNTILKKDRYYSKAAPVFFKVDATAIEEDVSDGESLGSTDEISSQLSDSSQEPVSDVEVENMDFNNDGYDVENEEDVWEKD